MTNKQIIDLANALHPILLSAWNGGGYEKASVRLADGKNIVRIYIPRENKKDFWVWKNDKMIQRGASK